MPGDVSALINKLRSISGRKYVLTSPSRMRPFATGYRCGHGEIAAVVRPGSLVEQWRVLQACVASGVIVIMQGANTGLTGGSTPNGDYDRPVIVLNAMRIAGIHLIDGGAQVVCLPGATLYALERKLRPLGREPHSVIGSSCIGASVLGGICNNSGGALIQRGPAYTECALFARLDGNGNLDLVNHLGIALGSDPETILSRVEAGAFSDADIQTGINRAASDRHYADHVRQINEPSPARFNADTGRLFEASGSAGKVALFAVRLDTFISETCTATFYIGTNDPAELTQIRRHMLAEFPTLPIAAEYIHKDAYDVAEVYGKDTFLAIQYLGTDRLHKLFAFKNWLDRLAGMVPFFRPFFSDRLLQALSRLFPAHLPARIRQYRRRFAHHLILKMGSDGISDARRYLAGRFPSTAGDAFECNDDEARKAFLHRFAVAGAAVRYRAINARDVEDIVALDIALRRDDRDWFEQLPESLRKSIISSLYYGHFFCHVFHQDYIVAKGHDPAALEEDMWALLDARGAEYPAEHNVGHLYRAKPALAGHYRALDPSNTFNPGIGHTSKCAHWR